MSRLSPALKSLINAAHSRPGAVPASPHIQAVYSKIECEATARKVGQRSWLALSTAVTMTMNSPDSMRLLFNMASDSKPTTEAVSIAEFMREVGLKCIGFNGVSTLSSRKYPIFSHGKHAGPAQHQHAQCVPGFPPTRRRVLALHHPHAASHSGQHRLDKRPRTPIVGFYILPFRE